MESRISWLGGSSSEEKQIDETLVSADTYLGNEVRLTSEQYAQVKADEQVKEEPMADLMEWLGVETVEEAEDFLADLMVP